VLLVIVRWLGKRMSGQLTMMEMAVMLTLGAIVSVPMQMPDRGLLQGVLLLMLILAFQRGITWLGVMNSKFENLTEGEMSLLVKDGVLQLKGLEESRVSRQQLFAELRQQQIFNLGMVDRIYLEACGLFSVFKAPKARPGLPLYPPDDAEIFKTNGPANIPLPQQANVLVCLSCGWIKTVSQDVACTNCRHDEFINAVS